MESRKSNPKKLVRQTTVLREQAYHASQREQVAITMMDFKCYVKRKYQTFLRAWRIAIDLDGSMTVQKNELFQAVKDMGWTGDPRLLWKGLDKDNSGAISLQELDMRTAEKLADFKEFVCEKFGGACLSFQAFDVLRRGRLKANEFMDACKQHGYEKDIRSIFHGINCEGNKHITEKDMAFLDAWKYPSYLTSPANEQAAQQFKDTLLRTHKSYVKAWRVCLDKDNSNQISWEEFEAAAKRMNFSGDLPGAWRYLDDNVSGFISLREIDQNTNDVLSEFKRWAEIEFGSVKAAFKEIDPKDASEGITCRQFREACATYGFQGDVKLLFDALDADRQGFVTRKKVAFLDTWPTDTSLLAEWDAAREKTLMKEAFDGGVEKQMFTKTDLCSPRINELALPREGAVPLPRIAPFGGSLRYSGDMPWSFPKSVNNFKRSPYLPKLNSARAPSTHPAGKPEHLCVSDPKSARAALREKQIEALKEAIVRLPAMKNVEQSSRDTGAVGASMLTPRVDIASIRSKTIALRRRTVELLGKDEEFENTTAWAVVDVC